MEHDIIVVGGGLAGAVTARKLAEHGRSVLVCEYEARFRDRVRGEQLHPWGGAAARRLGIYDECLAACGHDARHFNTYVGGRLAARRDLHATTPYGIGSTTFYHPAMQDLFLRAAERAGAEVRRGARVECVVGGDTPAVTFTEGGARTTASARIVVGADGRNSKVRRSCGFESIRDPDFLRIAGTLFVNTCAPDDGVHMCVGTLGKMLLCPLGNRRARAYFIYTSAPGRPRLSGADRVADFLALCRGTGAPESWFEGVVVDAPLADYEGAPEWVERPAKNGVALVGDAAAAPDPSFGSGMSKALLDVERLVEALTTDNDRDRALATYGVKHDEHYAIVHKIESWMTTLLWTSGPVAEARRERVMPRVGRGDPALPDLARGPDGPHDDAARRLLLAEA
jgi:2-polyprenyl-6-methoxyphenol hydroxylase-like FAD-dependent oxidoreductase